MIIGVVDWVMIPADMADIVPSSSEELTEELCFPRETLEIWVVLGGGEGMGDWLSKVTSEVVGISKEGITMDVFNAAEKLVERLIFKVDLEKPTEVARSIIGIFEVPCVSRDETDAWVALKFCVSGGVLLTMGINEELAVRDVT